MRNLIIGAIVAAAAAAAYLLWQAAASDPAGPDRARFADDESGATGDLPADDELAPRPALPRRMHGGSDASPAAIGGADDEVPGDEDRGRRDERRAQRLETFDRNGDGILDSEERAELVAAGRERSGDQDLELIPRPADDDPGDPNATPVQRMIEGADTDGDGSLSRSEFDSGSRAMRRILRDFDDVDTDGDGAIGTAELQRALEQRRQRQVHRPSP